MSPKRPFYHRLYRISTRITVPFLIITIVIAGIGVFVVTRLVAGSVEERLNNQLADSAQAASNAIVEIEGQQLATLQLMVFTEGVVEAIAAEDIETLGTLLRPIAVNAAMDDVIVFDRNGSSFFQLTRSSGDYASPVPLQVQAWPGVQNVLASNVDMLGDKFVDIADRGFDYVFYTSAPVFDMRGDGALVGGISVGIAASDFTTEVGQQALSDIVFYDLTGQILGSTFQSNTDASLKLSTAKVTEFLAHSTQAEHPLIEEVIDGITYQILYTPFRLRSQDVGLMAAALRSDFVVERISVSRNVFAALFVVMFVGVWMIAYFIGRSIINPVRQLVNTTRSIRSGDLSKRVNLVRRDELGELGLSFDHMTNQLVRRNLRINKLYSRQLQETARRDAILAGINDAVAVLNSSGKVILFNLTAQKLYQDLKSNETEKQIFVQLCKEISISADPQTVHLNRRFYNVLATPVHMESGELLGRVVVFRDITAVIETERIKDQMILQLSHELRTPLASARGYTELALRMSPEQLVEQRERFLGNAIDQMDVLTRMVNQVIDVSSILTGHLELDREPLDLEKLLAQVVEAQRPSIDQRELEVKLSISPPEEIVIEGDARRLANVFEHVLRNAYSYTLPGGWIEIQLRENGRSALVSVSDSGVGIGPDEIDKVFDRMYRGKAAEAGATDTRGLGLGLYISKQIVDAHQGRISLTSELDVGTTVTIELPKSLEGGP